MAINGTAVAITAAGAALLYSAVKNATVSTTVRSFLAGDPLPSPPLMGSGGGGGVRATFGSTGGGVPDVSSGSVVRQVQDWGIPRYGKSGTAAIMGNIERESGFTPSNDTGDGGTSGGICQWHLGRFDALKHYAAVRGIPWQDIRAQLGYLSVELSTGYADVGLYLRGPASVASKAAYFAKRFEACSECYSAGTYEVQQRIAAAQRFYAGM